MVRIGIIGIGGMGRGHARYLMADKVPGAMLTAVCDLSPDALAWAQGEWGDHIARFSSAEALFASKTADAVIIATPHYLHPPLAIEALNQELHVLVEKPAGVYTRQVREMNEVAARSDRGLCDHVQPAYTRYAPKDEGTDINGRAGRDTPDPLHDHRLVPQPSIL